MVQPKPDRAAAEEAAALGVSPRYGLTAEEVAARRARYGPNQLVPERLAQRWYERLRPLADPMVLLLLGAGLIFILLGEASNGAVMLIATIPVVGVDVALESRAEQALRRLRELAAPRVIVRRQGAEQKIAAEEVVPGDILLLHEGDFVPADALCLEASALQVDESALTGEALPVTKLGAGWRASPTAFSDPRYCLLAGTTVLSGQATAVAVATGTATEYGRLGAAMAQAPIHQTPLQRSINELVGVLGLAAVGLCFVVAGLELWRGQGLTAAILAGVALGIAAIPEEFPITFTLYLTLGAWRAARRNALIRRLAGVETLGSATVICVDKTGTLTEGRLRVGGLYAGGQLLIEPLPAAATGPAFASLVMAAALACEEHPFDPLDKAILSFAEEAGFAPRRLHSNWHPVHQYPFDPWRKYVSHVWRAADGRYRLYAKGSLEGILELALPDPETRRGALEANEKMAGQGMRVIAVAYRDLSRFSGQRWVDEAGLRFLGLIGFLDPPRPSVRRAVQACQTAGIRVIMITGDHLLTAHAIAEQIGLRHDDKQTITGDELESMSDEELARRVREVAIFARTPPTQKLRIVRALQANGEVVAMTGDGINDASALRAADIGIAMGQRGTEVAREAATMVLLDDNFRTIVEAIRQGRRIFDNLRHAFRYVAGFHVPIVLGALVVPILGAPLLLLPIHLVWLELIIHPTSAMVFEAEPEAPDLMRRPPRSPRETLFGGRVATPALFEGLLIFGGVLALYLWGLYAGRPVPQARSLALAALVCAQLILVLQERSSGRPFWERGPLGNRFLLPILLASLLSLLAMLYLPGLNSAAQLSPLAPSDWPLAIGVAAACTLVFEASKLRMAEEGTT